MAHPPAEGPGGESASDDCRERLARAQALVRKHVPRDVSLVDELLAERRRAAERE